MESLEEQSLELPEEQEAATDLLIVGHTETWFCGDFTGGDRSKGRWNKHIVTVYCHNGNQYFEDKNNITLGFNKMEIDYENKAKIFHNQ